MKWKTIVSLGLCALFSPAQAGQLIVGQVVPLTGLEATQGRAYSAGLQMCIAQINKAGGVNGHTFTLVRHDDGGKPPETLALTRKLLAESRPLVLAGYFGNRNIDGLVESGVLADEKISLLGYRISEVRGESPNLYNVRAGLREEVNKFVAHVATIGITRLGLVYEPSPNAAALVEVLQEAATRNNSKVVVKVSSAKLADAITAVQAESPQAVLIVTSGTAAASFIEQYRSAGGAAQLFAHSGADIEQLSKRLGEEQMKGVAIMQVTPTPYQIRSRLSKELADAVAAAKGPEIPISYAMMEGFIACRVIVEAVRRQGARVSREGMAAALDAMSGYDLGGYLIGYQPQKRSGSRLVELSIITADGKIRQ